MVTLALLTGGVHRYTLVILALTACLPSGSSTTTGRAFKCDSSNQFCYDYLETSPYSICNTWSLQLTNVFADLDISKLDGAVFTASGLGYWISEVRGSGGMEVRGPLGAGTGAQAR